MLAGLLLLQAVAGPPLPPELRKRPARPTMPCPVQTDPDGEIVVCARSTDQRLATLAAPVQPPRGDPLSFRLPGGGKGNVHAIRTQLPGASGQGGRSDAENAVR
ncbi:hypothetical protein NHF48_008420 [Sphingomonas sp. H160509]|uniref:hypothetical protein n=1 Tax=Sphingomonas sp. H160509 TaxID=2955313 RepID=UPI002097B21B|nr:hypothetical protein [Sphingomonas sp. H160509]MDD1450984.1 hypothetical protein [Sphingomonas sp. H160509]